MVLRCVSGKPPRQKLPLPHRARYCFGFSKVAGAGGVHTLPRKTPPSPAMRKPAMKTTFACRLRSARAEPKRWSWSASESVSWLPWINQISVCPRMGTSSMWSGLCACMSPSRMTAAGRCSLDGFNDVGKLAVRVAAKQDGHENLSGSQSAHEGVHQCLVAASIQPTRLHPECLRPVKVAALAIANEQHITGVAT